MYEGFEVIDFHAHFPTDRPWFPRGFAYRYLQDQVRDCLDLNMPDEHIQMIFGGNAARLHIPPAIGE